MSNLMRDGLPTYLVTTCCYEGGTATHREFIPDSPAGFVALCRRHAKQRRALGHEVVAYTTLARKALDAEHKLWMAGSRCEGAFRGDSEWTLMEHWSEAQIERHYDRAYDRAGDVFDRAYARADGLMSHRLTGTGTSQADVELPQLWFWTIAQSFGFDQLPWHLTGNADYMAF
jgi:hypothetical protein